MNILLISYYFYPELTPRAFRTFELVKELCDQNHSVKLLIPNKEQFKNKSFYHKNLTIQYLGDYNDTEIKAQSKNQSMFKKSLAKKSILKSLMPQLIITKIKSLIGSYNKHFHKVRNKKFIKLLFRNLIKDNSSYDLVLSIGLPIECHIGTALSIIRNKNLQSATCIADYGDPFSKQNNTFIGYQIVDHFIARVFDYVLVPTQNAKESFTTFKNENKIKIIPQAFDFSNNHIQSYIPNEITTFAFAGCFYKDLRNPSAFFNYLLNSNFKYKFIIYTITESQETLEIIEKYKDLFKDKLVIKYNIERDLLLSELSTMDFLLNFENTSKIHTPSKLIDYAITGRPICSLSTLKLETKIFEEFLDSNYTNETKINIEEYNIKKVTRDIIDIVNKTKQIKTSN